MLLSRWLRRVSVAGLAGAVLLACQPADQGGASDTSAAAASDGPPVVEIVAKDFAFEAPDTVPSGWTTFRMENVGEQAHFAFLYRLPEGKTFQDVVEEFAPPFDSAMHAIQEEGADQEEVFQILGRTLPEWVTGVTFMSGPGLASPGHTAQATVNLTPGTYVMECYVKTPQGDFHSALGMSRPLTVTEDSTGASAPDADLEITVNNDSMAVSGTPTAGTHTVAVRFAEHPSMGQGNDVHVARMSGETSPEELAEWMDWMNQGGLAAPAPVEFVGGAHEGPVGSTAYFTVTLEPGEYAWVSENHLTEKAVRTFTVE